MTLIKSKMLLFTAIAHYHTPSIMGPEKVVAERIARLHITKTYAVKAEKISSGTSVHGLIQVVMVVAVFSRWI